MEERIELVYEARMIRYNYLKGTKSDVAPILWQHGGIARLEPGEVIDKYLDNGYSTTSIGFAGLYEAVKFLTGESHTTEKGYELGMQIMNFLNDKAELYKKQTGIHFSVYGSPIESTTYRFAKLLKKRFGVIPGVTDKDYITNSYHVHVTEEIDAFSKLSLESAFQQLAPGGAISYVEVPSMLKNTEALLAIIKHIYHNIQYAEINTRADVCNECNFQGEILIDENLEWYCPVCGNRDQGKMQVTRRTCG